MWYKRGVRAAEFAAKLSKAEKASAPLDISVNVWYKRGVRAAEFAAELSKAEKTSAPLDISVNVWYNIICPFLSLGNGNTFKGAIHYVKEILHHDPHLLPLG